MNIVVVHVVSPDGMFLMGRRRDNNKWSSIVGHIHFAETPLQAATRELKEEAGIYATTPLEFIKKEDSVYLYKYTQKVKTQISNRYDPDREFKELKWFKYLYSYLPLVIPRSKDIRRGLI